MNFKETKTFTFVGSVALKGNYVRNVNLREIINLNLKCKKMKIKIIHYLTKERNKHKYLKQHITVQWLERYLDN